MKKLLSLALLFGGLAIASAATTNIYIGDWGTTNGGASVGGDGHINLVGWTGVAVSQTNGPYLGIYVANGPTDVTSGQPLPANTVYFTILTPAQSTPAMFYTTDSSGVGAGGDFPFNDIDPTQYTNLTFGVEVANTGGTPATNYFAVRVGGNWYVSTQDLTAGAIAPPQFTNATMPYTNLASAWRNLTINSTDVTIGSTPGGNLSGSITGIGLVQLPTGAGFNYNKLTISALAAGSGPPPTPPSITSAVQSQNGYAGGGINFRVRAGGSPPLSYIWLTNGTPVADGLKYSGSTNNSLIISNVASDDGALTYSVVVTNAVSGGSATNSGFALTVNAVTPDLLYAETFPYVGPQNSGNLGIGTVGWQQVIQGNSGIFFNGGAGNGAMFSYSGVGTTNIYFTTTTNDTGGNGLPFLALNPDSLPALTFIVFMWPGNGASFNPTNVVAYWAVQMDNGNWYSSANKIPVSTTSGNPAAFQSPFARTANLWKTLTIGANTCTIGNTPGSPLAGNIIGVGLVVAHLGNGGGGDFNFNNFSLSTNPPTVSPPNLSAGTPNSQIVAAGGGVSFNMIAAGSAPFTYGWSLNGVFLHDGGRISGSTTPTLTIANLTTNDNGPSGTAHIDAWVTNSANFDHSQNWVDTTLLVTNPDVGVIYFESFPYISPIVTTLPVASDGWVSAVSGNPNNPTSLYQRIGSDGAVFAYEGGPATITYYTTSASDTNQDGLPFPNIKLSAYPSLNISVDIAPTTTSSNVAAYLSVQLNGSAWYVSATALPVPTATDTQTFSTYNTVFDPTAANWKNLTIANNGALIGAPASANLKGVMTGVGVVFVYVLGGGNMNFDNLVITGTGLGGINVGQTIAGTNTLTWVGNPAVNLSSTTDLAAPNWQDVPNTLGVYSFPAQTTGPQRFFRLVQH
jgi:hypothetical protein